MIMVNPHSSPSPAKAGGSSSPITQQRPHHAHHNTQQHTHNQHQTHTIRGPRSLFLLEGLVQKPGMADAIVKDALQTFDAALRIARWLETSWRRHTSCSTSTNNASSISSSTSSKKSTSRKTKKRRRTDTATMDKPPSPSNTDKNTHQHQHPIYLHWLFRSLQSPSGPERQVACRILAMGCPLNQHHSLWSVLQVLHYHLRMNMMNKGHGSSTSADVTTVSLVALMKHILLLSITNTTTNEDDDGIGKGQEEAKEKDDVTPGTPASKVSKTTTTDAAAAAAVSATTSNSTPLILAFLRHKRMGLSWICSTLVKRAPQDSSSTLVGGGSVVSAALVDLLHHLLLVGTDSDSLAKAHSLLWKEENVTVTATATASIIASVAAKENTNASSYTNTLSPLACLIATHHVWKQQKHALAVPAQKDVLHILKHLIDPHTVPTKLRSATITTTSSSSSSGGSSNKRPIITRLWDTFPPSSSPSSSAATASLSASLDATTAALQALVEATSPNRNNNGNNASITNNPGRPSSASTNNASSSGAATDRSAAAAAVARIFSTIYGPNGPSGTGIGGTGSSDLSAAAQQALELFARRSNTNTNTNTTNSTNDNNNDSAAGSAGGRPRMFARRRGGAGGGAFSAERSRSAAAAAVADAAARMDVDDLAEDDDDNDDDVIIVHSDDDEDDDEDVEGHLHHSEEHEHSEQEHHHHHSDHEDEDDDEEDHQDDDDNDEGDDDDDPDNDEEDNEVEEGEHREDEEHVHEQDVEVVENPHHADDDDVDEDARGEANHRNAHEGGAGGEGKNGDEDDDDDDEEIDSNSEDDEDCEFDHDEDEDGEHDIVMRHHPEDEEDEDDFRQGLLDLHNREAEEEERRNSQEDAMAGSSFVSAGGATAQGNQAEQLAERRMVYLRACMQVLAVQHPVMLARFQKQKQQQQMQQASSLPIRAEHDLMHSVLNIVKPPKKPVNAKILLRRAPTQEDFFRGSLSKNPISLNMLRKDGNTEPTVRDLRQQIADDLQMSDSAELLELLVANKIIDVDLKLRVVHQVVWKRHLIQTSTGGGGGPGASSAAGSALSSFLGGGRGVARSLLQSRSGLSMIFSSSGALGGPGVGPGGSIDANGNAINEDTPLAALPPMVVTYRLTGVDGEATEDTVTTLEDPEAPSETADPEQLEKIMEKEFGITRFVTEGRGVYCLLKSVERNINDTLRKIRRDDIGNGENLSRGHFKTSSPFPGLSLLSCCAKLASNRKLLLQSRAPTILLRLLLDVLHGLEDEGLSESNPTAKGLQELIEILASDMVSSNGTAVKKDATTDEARADAEQDASTLRLLLSAIETSSLSRPLRNVIAKLLPYLTYGQSALSKELAMEFVRHVDLQRLGEYELECEDYSQVLMATFVHASSSLPANEVCHSLRTELIQCGYLDRVASFVMQNCPSEPPCWTSSLWVKGDQLTSKKKSQLEKQWRIYMQRSGLKPAFDMLIGLSKQHKATQSFVGTFKSSKQQSLIEVCHWIESTSDSTSARVTMKGLGLVAETLLDELASDGSPVATEVKDIRRKTRNRKKEIAMERRSKALVSMGAFGPNKAAAASSPNKASDENNSSGVRGTAASLLAPVFGFFQNSEASSSQPPPSKRRKKDSSPKKEEEPPAKPAWMAEMEDMEDETGLTCAVCQEGRTLQPSELLGLYAYVKKVSVPLSQCGGRSCIDGTSLLTALPPSMPSSLSDSHAANEWYPAARAVAEELKDTARSSLSSLVTSRRATYFTTTVSAGNAIHFSCHNRARQADRNHPKAPKSEWEGASLRNSRVNCNVILPLVSSRSSKVPLVAVDVALTEHQTAVSNLLGARPKSMLWNILHDVRFLLLRMAYGEPLNADCGGGSLVSNSQLVYHQLLMADMFEKDAQVDAPEMAQHARNLSAGFLAASAMTHADDYNKRNQSLLHRGMADSSAMACLTCILFHNTKDDYGAAAASTAGSEEDERPHPKRRWVVGRDYFLRGLLNCAGRRHALGVEGSGCTTSRNTAGAKRRRPGGFADWDIVDEDEMLELAGVVGGDGSSSASGSALLRSTATTATLSIEDFRDALRPMIVYFALMDQLSNDFVLSLDDLKVDEFANRLVEIIHDCQSCKSIHELLRKARVSLEEEEIIDELQKGMMAA